jgi:hypothetical protein
MYHLPSSKLQFRGSMTVSAHPPTSMKSYAMKVGRGCSITSQYILNLSVTRK